MTGESQSQCVVFSVTGVGHTDVTQQWCIEGPGCSQSVDAQSIVCSVLVRPFPVVDDTRRKCVQTEISHAVCSDNHGTLLFVKLVDNGLQGSRTAVKVIAVKLNRKASAVRMMHTQVPASADSQIRSLGNKMNDLGMGSIALDDFSGSVVRMIVDDNQIERKICLLFQYGTDGIFNGPYPVAYRDDDRCFVTEVSGRTVYPAFIRRQPGMNILEVAGESCFAFQLDLPVARIHIVELLLT